MRVLTLFWGLYAILVLRYFVVAGTAYWWWWRRESGAGPKRRIRPSAPCWSQCRREMLWSLATSSIFAAVGAMLWHCWELGYTQVYLDLAQYGWGYLGISFLFLMLVHETYFYWTHRLMHHPKLFARIHRVHHESRSPTPWAAFSFHPWEAIIAAAIFPAFLFTIPIHPTVLFSFLTVMTLLSVVNHLGVEIYPRGFARHPIGKWIISATHHSLHHAKGRGNYGLYFTLWDHLVGTEDESYCNVFEQVTA